MDINKFFKKLATQPMLMWKALMPLLFIILAFVILFIEQNNFPGNTRFFFAALLFFYGLFRFYSFYTEYNRSENDSHRQQ